MSAVNRPAASRDATAIPVRASTASSAPFTEEPGQSAGENPVISPSAESRNPHPTPSTHTIPNATATVPGPRARLP
nr:hypothetical protein GCM10020093_066100 [Planobispora longispora]